MQFPQEKKSPKILFPHPANGAIVTISPPHFAWLPTPGAQGYRLEVSNSQGDLIYQKEVGNSLLHIPEQVWAAGCYFWHVVAWHDDKTIRRGKQTFTIPPDVPSLPWPKLTEILAQIPKTHPRFLYTEDKLSIIRRTLNSTRKQQWQNLQQLANRVLDTTPPIYPSFQSIEDASLRTMQYKEYFHAFRTTIDQTLQYLALAYLVTKENKYLLPAKKILLEVASWPTNDEDVTSVFSSSAGDEIGLSLARILHRAYDWLYDGLTTSEREIVLKACIERASQTFRLLQKRDYHTFPGRSHPGRLVSYLLEMSLVLAYDTPEISVWANYTLKAMMSVHPHWGSNDGGWAQGIWYAKGYNMYSLPAIEALANTCNVNLWQRPFYRRFGSFLFYCTSILGEIKPFGDGAERTTPGTCGGYLRKIMRLYAQRFNDHNLGWWASQVAEQKDEVWALILLYEDRIPNKIPDHLPNAEVFPEVGWAALHSDITSPAQDTFLLFKSSPYGSASHSHGDQNTFAILKGGVALAIPSGYYGPHYNSPHHQQWTQSTKANNCVLVNGEGQGTRDNTATGRILDFQNYPQMCYVAGDATLAYQGKLTRCERHILFLRPGLFILLDDLETPQPATFQWMLHSLEKMHVDGNTILSRRKGAELQIKLYASQKLHLTQTDLFVPSYNTGIPKAFHREVPNHWHLSASTQQKCQSIRIVAIMSVRGSEEKLDVEVWEEQGWICAVAHSSLGTVTGGAQLITDMPVPEKITKNQTNQALRLYGKSLVDDVVLAIK